MKAKLFLIAFLFLSILAQSQPTKIKTINGRIVDSIDVPMVSGVNAECDTIFSFPTTDLFPIGLTYDGTHIYSFGLLHRMIYKYSLEGDIMDSIPYPSINPEPGGDMDFDGTFLWTVIEQERRIYKLNPSNGDTITSFILPSSDGGDPDNYGCAYENGHIWITEYSDGTLMRINATTGAVIDSFDINRKILPLKIIKGELYGIQFPDYSSLDFLLVKFDKKTGAVIDSFPWCIPYPLGITWADDHLWGLSSGLSIGNSRIYKFDFLLSSSDYTKVTSNRSVTVFPNPTSNQVTISSPDLIQSIELYTMIGEKVYTMSGMNPTLPYEIDLSAFPKGVYLIRTFDGLRFYVEKLVVQ